MPVFTQYPLAINPLTGAEILLAGQLQNGVTQTCTITVSDIGTQAINFGNVSPIGSTTPRLLNAWASDFPNVKFFGAAGNGTSDDSPAFQALLNGRSAGINVMQIPTGNYAGSLGSVTVPTGVTPVWIENGLVTYVSSPPPGARAFTSYSGDMARPWFTGNWGFGNDKTSGTSASGDKPSATVQRHATHTGGSTGGIFNASSLFVYNKVESGVSNYENGIVSQIDVYSTAAGQPNFAAFQGSAFRYVPGNNDLFGANFVSRDQTGRMSSVAGAQVGLENDVVGSGPDDAAVRVICDNIYRPYQASADGNASCAYGVRVRPSNTSPVSGTITNAFYAYNGTLGSITNAYVSDGATGNGLQFTGTYGTALNIGGTQANGATFTGQAVIIRGARPASVSPMFDLISTSTNTADLRIATRVNTVAAEPAILRLEGWNSSSTLVPYAKISSIISSNTAGSEQGGLRVYSRQSGAASLEAQFNNGLILGSGSANGAGTLLAIGGGGLTPGIEAFASGTSGLLRVGSNQASNGQTAAIISLSAWNTNNVKTAYANITGIIGSSTAGAETGVVQFSTKRSGTSTTEATLGGGMYIGAATGAGQGVGSINLATALYVNGVQVVEARQTGWTAGTGATPNKGAMDYGSATVATLAARMMAIEQALFATTGHGLIGP